MKSKIKETVPIVISYFFILLFCYASISKILDFENFQVQIAQSPLLSAYAGITSFGIIIVELIVVLLLCFPTLRKIGLYGSLGLMSAFSVYIYLILNYSDFVPCSCGGILEKLGWTEHLIFNLVSALLAIIAVILSEKRKLLIYLPFIIGIIVISCSIVVYLFYSSEHIIKKENNFIRRFPHHPIMKEGLFDLKVNSYYFAGFADHHIYLGNQTSPFQFFIIDDLLKTFETVNIQPENNHKFRNLRVKVVKNQLFLYDGTVPVIYAASPNDFSGKVRSKSFQDVYFEQLAIIDSTNYYFTAVSSSTHDKVLGSLQLYTKPSIKLRNDILLKNKDGIFDTDGRLISDEKNNEVYYIHYYSNKIIKIDLNQKAQAYSSTIDPTAAPNIQTINLKDGGRKMKEPPPTINRSMAVYGGLIFNESPRLGKYEQKSLWKDNFIVDVYKTYPAGYWGSFYIPKGNEKSLQMLVTDQYLFVLTGTKIIKFRLEKSLKDSFR